MSRRTIVNGGFQDGSGAVLALGKLVVNLLQDFSNSGVQICSGVAVTMNLDANGNVTGSPQLWAPATYLFRAYTALGQLVWQSVISIADDTVPYSLTPVGPYAPLYGQVLPYGNLTGNHLDSSNVLSPPISPQAGDVLVFFVEASFGCNATTTQPTFTITDDAGNTWVNAGDAYDGTGTVGNPAGSFISQLSISTWTTVHNGNPITTIHTVSTVVPDAFNFQGSGSLSVWRLPGNIGVTGFYKKIITTLTSSPTIDPFTTGGSSLVIADSTSAETFTNSSYAPGYTPITVHTEYITGSVGTYQPFFNVTGAATSYPHWAIVALTIGIIL